MASAPSFRVLFVCMGNICRSPAAEAVLRHLDGDSGAVEIDSAGTIDFHTGKPSDARMRAAAARRGIPVDVRARQVKAADLARFDLILAMDHDNLADLRHLDADGAAGGKLRLFCEFCTRHPHTQVPDPYYGGDEGFELVLDLLEDGCANLLNQIRSGELARD
ncbi:MAG: low molecular weight protein-tyrosine-phosphatase [Verrucomicrobiales bacterium]